MDRKFYARDTETVARDLLGCILVRRSNNQPDPAGTSEEQWIGGLIVETEAYLPGDVDPASHSVAGRTRRNKSMFGPPGIYYVYQIHTRHCLNVSTSAPGVGTAVLIRSIQPIWGIETIAKRRGVAITHRMADIRRLTSGPGMLCQALSIDLAVDGRDSCQNRDLQICHRPVLPPFTTIAGPRIGITAAADLPLRFFVDGNRYVSGPTSPHTVPRRQSFAIESRTRVE